MLSIVLAVLAAASNAVSAVAQRKANRDEAKQRSFGVSLLLHLLTRPAWLLGFAAMIVSFLLQATALGFGSLALVEPVLVLELPLTLVLAAAVFQKRLRRRDLLASLGMTAGLALLIAVLDPSDANPQHVSTTLEVVATLATLGGVATLTIVGLLGSQRARPAMLGVAAGSSFGLTASLMKLAVTRLSDGGAVALFTTWQTYAMAAVGVLSVVLVQAALNAGTLVVAQPGITLLDPLVSVLWGTVVLGEQIRTGPILLLAALGGASIVAGVVWLARSPTLAGAVGQ